MLESSILKGLLLQMLKQIDVQSSSNGNSQLKHQC